MSKSKQTKLSYGNLVRKLAEKRGLSLVSTKSTLDDLFNILVDTVRDQMSVALPIGTFSSASRKARTGRNPKTGAAIKISARNTVVFKPSSSLKESVNESKKK